MPSHLKFCRCRQCRRGLRTKFGGDTVRRAIRRFRRLTKQQIKRGEEPLIQISVPYTDRSYAVGQDLSGLRNLTGLW